MLGWTVHIRKKSDPDSKALIAKWETGVYGLSWIDDLVKKGQATNLGGWGYPCSYSMKAGLLKAILNTGIPGNTSPPVFGEDYVLPAGYQTPPGVNQELLAKCHDEEELLIEAWDMS